MEIKKLLDEKNKIQPKQKMPSLIMELVDLILEVKIIIHI